MKKICSLGAIIITAMMLVVPSIANAAGETQMYYYDFEDYTAADGSNKGPDEKWRDDPSSVYWSVDSYGSTDLSDSWNSEDAAHGRVLSLYRGQASLYFDEVMTDGKLHISFDARSTHPDLGVLFHSYTNDKGYQYSDGYAKYVFLNGYNDSQISYYTGLTNWDVRHFDASVSPLEWHHYDVVMTGISEADAKAMVYVDGKLIHNGHRPSSTKGLMTFSVRAQKRTTIDEWPPESERIYVDNILIRNYHNDTALALVSTNVNSLPTENAVVEVKLSERVNADLIEENVEISGPEGTPDYSILNISDTGFTVSFNETLAYGKYSITLSDAVTGEISKMPVKYPLVLKTSDRYAEVVTDYHSDDFNDYAGDGILPEGFISTEGTTENEYAKKTPGSSGQEEDFAFGLLGFTKSNRKITSMYSKMLTKIPENREYTVSFDIKAKNMYWYLYLPEEGDIEDSEITNVAIGADQKGVLKYSKSRSSSPATAIGNGITLEPENWHNIVLTVAPDKDTTRYKIKVDGGEEYILDTSRKFHINKTEGIGFGYRENGSDAELHIDNLKISGDLTVKFPEIESITLYDCNGNEVSPNGTVTTKISEARVKYNTLISEDYTDFVSLYKDGAKTAYESELVVNDDGTNTVVISFPDMLEPMISYSIVGEIGLKSYFTDDATTYMEESISINTLKDVGYEINDMSYDAEKGEAILEIIKNNSGEGRYIFAVCSYKDIEIDVNGEQKTIKRLSDMEFIPIEITSDKIGVFRYTLPFSADGEECEIIPYLWNHPKLDTVLE